MLSVKPTSSRAPSGPPSIRSQTPTVGSTPPSKAASHAQLPQINSSTLKSRLKNMFDTPRHSTFAINLTIHELGNVPQLDGQFAVKWKFRGRKSQEAEHLLEHPVQRAQVIESKLINKVAPPLRHSASAMSLQTTLTSSTGHSNGTAGPWKVNRVVSSHPVPHPHHSSSLPSPLSPHAAPDSRPRKATDPTPLRQVSGTSQDTDVCQLIIEEPIAASPHSTILSDDISHSHTTSSSTVLTQSTDDDACTTQSTSSPRNYPASLGPDTDTHSFVSTAQSIAATDTSRPRVSSRASTRSDKSTNPSVVVTRHRPPTLTSLDMDHDSAERKGRTPTCSIRSHAVAWDYKVQYVVRVPLGKPVEVEEPAASRHHHNLKAGPPPKQYLPILGGGPLSESSIKLDIEQVDQRGEAVKTPSGRDVLFGFVNIDLAPFADHGPVTRKFLLKNSKTNATIRVTIDMRYIGGEQNWATPPMEGHLAQGLSELTGEDNYPELQLLPSRSVSSSSDQSYPSSLIGRPAGRSTPSLNKLPSSINAAVHSSKHRYRTYEHHLLPEIVSRKQTMAAQRGSSTLSSSPPASAPSMPPPMMSWNSYSGSSSASNEAQRRSPRLFPNGEGMFTTSPQILPKPLSSSPLSTPGLSSPPLSPPKMGSFSSFANGSPSPSTSPSLSPVLSPVVSRSSIITRLSPITTRIDTPSDGSGAGTSLLSGDLTPMSGGKVHRRHTHYLRDRDRDEDVNDLQPDVVIESIFNPSISEELTPFTYVPNENDSMEGEGEEEEDEDEDEEGEGEFGCRLTRSMRFGATLTTHAHNPTKWNRIRRRVMSHPHKLA